MARTVTLSELRTRALRRAKMEQSQFPDIGEVDRLVREAVTELYDKLVEARGAHQYMCEAEAITVANASQLYLPADFYKLLSVAVNPNVGAAVMPSTPLAPGYFIRILTIVEKQVNGWQLLQPFGDQEQVSLMNAGSASPYGSQYRLRGLQNDEDVDTTGLDMLEIRPLPTTRFLVRIGYIPRASTESWGGGPTDPVVNGINGWEDYIAIRVAMTLLDEEESDTRHLERDLARIEARIASLADNRDSGRPERMQDTQGLLDSSFLWGIPVRPRDW